MFLADYHTHSICSPDGHAPLAEMARSGLDVGLSELCLTDHCDLLDYHGNPVHTYNWAPVEEQLALAQAQAREIVVDAHAQAKEAREKALRDSQRELKRIASEAAGKLAFHKDDDPFDSFLDLAEGGTKHESR